MKLRPYQTDLIKEARQLMIDGKKSVIIQSATGSGKTCLTAQMLKTASNKGMSALFLVHRRELVKQSILAFSEVDVKHGVIANGWPINTRLPIQIASVQTLVRRLKYLKEPSLIVTDEVQHCVAGSWKKIYEAFPNSYRIGLTATPQRLDGSGLNKFYESMIHGPSVRWLIDNGFLADYKMFAPSKINTSELHTRMGDFIQSEVETLIDRPTITGDAVSHYRKYCDGRRAVVFCASIKHSNHVVDNFNSAGIKAVHIDGETEMNDRDRLLRLFAKGDIQVVSNVDLFGEGFDLPVLEAVIMLRPTQSLGLYLQQVGRCLRPSPGKKFAIIMDHVGNVDRHGLPDDDRDWTLDGNKGNRSKSEQSIKIKTCPKCYAVQTVGLESCGYCGFIFESKPREIDHVEGELVEVDYQKLRKERLKAQGKCQTREDLVAEGKKRGYKHPQRWAHYILQARQARKMNGKT